MVALLVEYDGHHGSSAVVNLGNFKDDLQLIAEEARQEAEHRARHFDIYHKIICIDKKGRMFELRWDDGQMDALRLVHTSRVIVEGE